MTESTKAQRMRVMVYGTEYNIRATEDPEHIRKIAKRVDNAMRALAEGNRTGRSITEIAVMVALHFANEMVRTEQELDDVLRRLDGATDALAHAVLEDQPSTSTP